MIAATEPSVAWFFVAMVLSVEAAWAAAPDWSQIYRHVAERIPDELKSITNQVVFPDEVPDAIAEAEIRRLQQTIWQAETPRDDEFLRPLSPGDASRMFAGAVNHDPLGEICFPGEPAGGPFDEALLSSGEVRLSRHDFTLPTRGGLGFQFERHYRSFREYDGALGVGWDHNHNQRLIFNAASPADATRAVWHTGGGTIEFTRRDGEWHVQPGAFATLQREGREMLVRSRTGLRYVFEQAETRSESASYWRINRITTMHRNGRQWPNQLAYRYQPGSDRLREVIDPFERVVRFGYSADGRLTGVHAGQISVRFHYADGGLLERVTHLAVALGVGETSDLHETYAYALGAPGGTARMTAFRPFGERVSYDYAYEPQRPGVPGRVLSVQESDSNGTALATWKFPYSEQGRRRRATYRPPAPSPEEVWEFFVRGDVREAGPAKLRLPAGKAIPGRKKAQWRFERNADGLIVQTDHPSGRRTRWNYDSSNTNALMRANLLSTRELPRPGVNDLPIREFGVVQHYHSALPLPIAKERYEVGKDGKRRTLETERYEYNEFGDEVFRTVGDWSSWTVYTPYGEPAIEVDGTGAMTGWLRFERFNGGEASLAGGGLLAREVMDAIPTKLLKEARQARLALPANLPARKLSAVPTELEVRYEHDDMGRLRHEQHPNYRVWHVPGKAGMILAQYDSRGDLTVSRYADDLRLASRGERFSVPSQSNAYTGESWPGLAGKFRVEEFHRDPRGLLIRWVRSRERFGKALPEVRYERFPDGTIKQRQAQGEAALLTRVDPKTGWVTGQSLISDQQQLPLLSNMEYDAEGNLISFEDDGGQRHRHNLDPFGRHLSEQTPDLLTRETRLNGAGRPSAERVVSADGVTRDEVRYTYNKAGLPLLIERRRLAHNDRGIPIIDEWLVQEQNEHDAAGRVIRTRGFHEESSVETAYDGLGRPVEIRSPGGDLEQRVYTNEWQIAAVHTYCDTRDKTKRMLANFTFYTTRGEPWLQVPVARTNEPAFDRAAIQRFDRLGRVVLSAQPGKTFQRHAYNSLDQIERTVATPIDKAPGVDALVSETKFDVAGRKVSTTLRNRPLAIIGPDNIALRALRADVPQIRRFEYDLFGRLRTEMQPDGLRTVRQYGRGSMITQLSRERNGETETLRFEHDAMRRLTAIRGNDNQVVQRFEYHPLGYVVRADDQTIPGRGVTVVRSYDSFGSVLSERTSLPKDLQPVPREVTRTYDYRRGESSVEIAANRNTTPFWRRKTFRADGQGRVRRVLLDDQKVFAEYDYVGPLPVVRRIPDSGLVKTTALTPFLEVQAERWTRLAVPQEDFAEFHYYHDKFGDLEAHDLHLPSQEYQATHLYGYDAFQRLSRQGVLRRIFDRRDDRMQYLNDDSKHALPLESTRISRTEYDSAGNRIHQYSTRDRDAGQHFSPAKPFLVPDMQTGLRNAAEHPEMASDRLGAVTAGNQLQQTFDYDSFGRMTTFNSKRNNQALVWQVEYDALGRATKMTGRANGCKPMTLEFATDAFNRRVMKKVEEDGSNGKITHWAFTTYEDMLPLWVEERITGRREPDIYQYLWGPGQREALMAVLPKSRVERAEDRVPKRYHLHQNRQLNVFASTTFEDGLIRAFDVSDYADFGESATHVGITNITASSQVKLVEGSIIDNCLKDKLDEKNTAQWSSTKGEPPYALLLSLKHEAVLDTLNIWFERFPNTFRVIIPDQGRGEGESLSGYMERLLNNEHQRAVTTQVEDGQYSRAESRLYNDHQHRNNPYRLDLGRKRGRHILLVWDKPEDISVIQFEVQAHNQPASSLAFAGAWLDEETGLYYQGARYRLPEMGGKFISPDPLGFIASHNLYAYANNDPLTYFDPDGEAPHVLIGAGVGAGLGAGFYLSQVLLTDEEFNLAKFGIYTGAGALSGAAAAATFGAMGGGVWAATVAGAAGGGTHGVISGGGITAYETGDWRHALGDALLHGGIGALSGAAGGAVGGAILGKMGNRFHLAAQYALSGVAGGAAGGGVGGFASGGRTIDGWNWHSAGIGTLKGMWQGAVVGGAMGLVAYSSHQLRSLPYKQRPGFQTGFRDDVHAMNINPRSGRVHDPLTGRFIGRNQNFDLGHRPGFEYRKHVVSATKRGISRELFRREYNNPSHYRPELPSSNRSHVMEDMTRAYFGP
jgi:RHS repeat-associated protein